MDRPPAPVHYLRPNHAEWSPPAVIFLDTETRVLPGVEPETLALRCWAAHYVDRKVPRGGSWRCEWGRGTTSDELAAWIDARFTGRTTVWLYCHNLAFDLVTTRLPLALTRAGWRVSEASVGGKAPWLRLGKGKRRLTVVDSWSWLPGPLESLAQRAGLVKPPLPDDGDSLDRWMARCVADVAILESVMLELMDWWDRNQLGRWNLTGASTGWNAFRHTRTGERIVVDPDPEPVAADRAAYHGGRRGTWSIGEHRAGPFFELDFAAAYPTIAAELPLPVGRARRFDSLDTGSSLVTSDRWGIVARCRIKTDVPRWPCRVGKRTWYPVGEFWADLAGPDIAAAADAGALVEIGPGTVHRLGRAMSPWARWCLDVQNGEHPDSPPAARFAAKHWGRSVIGKWAARGFEKIELGGSPLFGWGHEEVWHHDLGVHGQLVDLGGRRWLVFESGDNDNAYPAVPAYVESHVRVRLNRAIEALGAGCVLQCDTDGLIVSGRTVGTRAAGGMFAYDPADSVTGRLARVLDSVAPLVAPLVLRVKSRADHVKIMGPQHLMFGDQRRLSGIPGNAVEQPDGSFRVKQWPGLTWQMRHGSAAGYVRPERNPHIRGSHPTGWVLADGRVVPVEARISREGTNTLVGWESSAYARSGLRAAAQQHRELEGYW